MTTMDTKLLHQLRREYRNADSRREERRIENDVVEAVLWQEDSEPEDTAFAVYSREELEAIQQWISEDRSEHVAMLLRRPYLKDVESRNGV